MDLTHWLDDKRLVVCVGSGGVGKTTTAAAVGLWGAIHGKKVMVLTIDPAKRLANSLGLEGMPPEGAQIDLSSMPDAKGELWAMMLDMKQTFDDLVTRNASEASPMRDYVAPGIAVEKGSEWGRFEFGSTLVVIAAPGRLRLESRAAGTPLRLGEAIGRLGRDG